MFHKGRFVALLCLAVVLLATLLPAGSGPLPAVLVAIALLVGATTVTPIPRPAPVRRPASPFRRSLGSRAPPLS